MWNLFRKNSWNTVIDTSLGTCPARAHFVLKWPLVTMIVHEPELLAIWLDPKWTPSPRCQTDPLTRRPQTVSCGLELSHHVLGGSESHFCSTWGETEIWGEKNKVNMVTRKYVSGERQRHTRTQMLTSYYCVCHPSSPYQAWLYFLPLGTMEFT